MLPRQVGIQRVPALATLVCRSAVPGHGQGLQFALGQTGKILLKRRKSEGIGDIQNQRWLVDALLLNADLEALVVFKKTKTVTPINRSTAIEAAKYGLLSRPLHGLGVMGLLPISMLLLMTGDAIARR